MLPAEKTHYRKGLALGMTLAEVFCVVVFIMLLACAVLILAFDTDQREPQGNTAMDSLKREAMQLQSRLDSLEVALAGTNRQLDDALGRAEYRERQLSGQGSGIDPPPCWRDDDGDPEFVFRVEFTEVGMVLHNIAPPRHGGDEAMWHARRIEDGQEYTPSRFRELSRPIYDAGRDRDGFGFRGCRYYVELDHQVGELPGVYQDRMADLERYFFYRRLRN